MPAKEPPSAALTDMVCEAHPELKWPHDDCAGPGMPAPTETMEPESQRVAPAEAFHEPPAPPPPRPIRYNGQGTFVAKGATTGSRYTFRGHGAILAVDAEDVEALLATELRRSRCCGRGTQVLRPFETVPTGGADYSHDD